MAATKRLLKERINLERDPIPYVTFVGEEEDDDNDVADSSGGRSQGIFEWRTILALDPEHDSLDDSSIIGKAKDCPYCALPPSLARAVNSSSSGEKSKAAGLLAGVTRAAKSSRSSSSDAVASRVASPAGGPAYFAFKFVFPTNYPFKPPIITVLSHTYHPNINTATGEICDSILTGEGWGPTLNIRKVCARLRKFLCDPDPDHPLESEIAQMLVDSPDEYRKTAFKYASDYATRAKAFEALSRGKK